ncbi:MAG TPA: hypothetical protein VFM53_13035 [Anaeromyxobacteraceae bacterium]|nr:hypothetical protein [Anaeromyxobacteraceae bacterium]
MNVRTQIVAAAFASLVAIPALAAEPTCTVCGDPTWPTLTNPMPGMPVYEGPTTPDRTAVGGKQAWQGGPTTSTGIGVGMKASAAATVYADPTWPALANPAAGMGEPRPSDAAPAARPATVHVAAR